VSVLIDPSLASLGWQRHYPRPAPNDAQAGDMSRQGLG
jgi:hypothetical protein